MFILPEICLRYIKICLKILSLTILGKAKLKGICSEYLKDIGTKEGNIQNRIHGMFNSKTSFSPLHFVS